MNIALISDGVLLISILIGLFYDYLCHLFLTDDKKQYDRLRPGSFGLSRHLPLIMTNITLLCVFSFGAISLFHHYFRIVSPTWLVFISQFSLIFYLDDLNFYFWHRFLHKNKYMMKHIHGIHHRARVPYPIEFIYVHPLEWLGGTLGIVVAVAFIIFFHGFVNAYVIWAYSAFRTLREMHIHSNFNALFFKKMPLIANAEHHGLHHMKLHGNFASTLTYLDKLCKTEIVVE